MEPRGPGKIRAVRRPFVRWIMEFLAWAKLGRTGLSAA